MVYIAYYYALFIFIDLLSIPPSVVNRNNEKSCIFIFPAILLRFKLTFLIFLKIFNQAFCLLFYRNFQIPSEQNLN